VNAPKTVDRVTSFFQEDEQNWARTVLSTVLNAVLSQALIRTRNGTLTLAYELLVNTPAVRQQILDNKVSQIQNLMFTGRQDGQVLMQQSLARKVREGLITREDAAFACEDPAVLDKELAR
jgi:twitching motility protein PilT